MFDSASLRFYNCQRLAGRTGVESGRGYTFPIVSAARLSLVVVLAGLACVVSSTRTFVSFERVRSKLVETPVAPERDSIRITSPDLDQYADLGAPAAVILRLRSDGQDAVHFTVSADDTRICESTSAPGDVRRMDCAVDRWTGAPGQHSITVAGSGGDWYLEYLEVATHHGGSRGIVSLIVLPRESRHYVPLPAVWSGVLFVVLTALLLGVRPTPFRRAGRLVYRCLCGAIVLVLSIVQLAPALSPFRIIISSNALVLFLGVLCLPRLRTVWNRLALVGQSWGAVATIVLRSSVVALCVAATFAVFMRTALVELYAGNYSGFLNISRKAFDQNPLFQDRADVRASAVLRDDGGYDGQFAYVAAFDPLMRAYARTPSLYARTVDAVPYRYGRIGFPWLVRLVAGGHWRAYPGVMIWLILGGLFSAAFVLATMAQFEGLSPLVGGLIVIVPGFWQSIQTALPEPIAAATILAGCFFVSRARWTLAALCLALSLLVRETGIVMVICIAAGVALSGRRRESMRLAVAAIAPMALWRLYVGWTLLPASGLRGFFDQPDDLGWPFAGFVELWRIIATGSYVDGTYQVARAGATYPFLLIAGLLLAAALAIRASNAVNVAALIYAAIAVCLNYAMIWIHVGNGQRGTFELFVALALSVVWIRQYPRMLRLGLAGFWCGAWLYTFYGAFDAGTIRAALTPGS